MEDLDVEGRMSKYVFKKQERMLMIGERRIGTGDELS
jgi:hypothetical protein